MGIVLKAKTLKSKIMGKFSLAMTSLILSAFTARAGGELPAEPSSVTFESVMYILLFILITFLILIILYGLNIVRLIERGLNGEDLTREPSLNFNKILTDSVPIEKEEEIAFHHEYDGIRELDNNLPPWWIYMFYATIVFAFIYMGYYHLSDSSDLQIAEYDKEMAQAEKLMASRMNENTVTFVTDKALLEEGKKIFIENCAACHGKEGQGGIGPNLVDPYWMHGGGIRNVFKTIKNGVPGKSMKAWQNDFSPKQIQGIASYIITLQGTKPANAKEPQGELYEDKVAVK
jgi:cytochrome c oxidase cbb3-type subunit III